MYRVMIAEDEPLERKALNFLCNKFFENKLEVICEAANGEEAVKKARLHKPDIILMDINMPEKDGLKASAEIKNELGEDVEIIILTAYSYFEYAKEAIKLGINDYLLKPTSNDEFEEAVSKIIQKIDERNKQKHKIKELTNKQRKLLPFLERELIMKVIYGSQDVGEYAEYLKMLDVNIAEYSCMIVKFDNLSSPKENLLRKIKTQLSFDIFYMISGIYIDEFIFVLFDKKLEEKQENKRLDDAIERLKNYLKSEFSHEINVSISGVYKYSDKMHVAYEEAKSLNITNLTKQQSLKYDYREEQKLFKMIINENSDATINVFEKIFAGIISGASNEQDTRQHLDEFLLILNRNIMEFWGEDFQAFNLESVRNKINDISELAKIGEYIKNVLNEIVLNISTNKRDKNTVVIDEVKKYINENYKQNISLDDVAEKIDLSSYYLSKLFKKVEKVNFKDYVIRVKMEKAKKMLRDEQKSIKETAFELGYADPNYFSRAFKKYMGISATKYSKM